LAPASIAAPALPDYSANFGRFCQAVQTDLNLADSALSTSNIEDFAQKIHSTMGWQLRHNDIIQRQSMVRIGLQFDIENDLKNDPTTNLSIDINLVVGGGAFKLLHGIIMDSQRPLFFTALSGACAVIETRHITYDRQLRASELLINRIGQPPLTRPLNPAPLVRPEPHAAATDSVIVGHVDSGIDYHRPDFAEHLIYRDKSTFLGRDFWDDDQRPYDNDSARSAFFPQSHGSYVLDILHQSGAHFRVLPVRYPRPDMRLMGAAVEWLAEHGATLIMVPLGSQSETDWTSFFAAAKKHPELLFIISAGNNGFDLSQNPIYPAVNSLTNAITVTSTFADGTLPEDANYGAAVAIGTPAEKLLAAGSDSYQRQVSGSSFAVPRLAAYALCLAAATPHITGKNTSHGATWANAIKAALTPSAQKPVGYDLFLPTYVIDRQCATQ